MLGFDPFERVEKVSMEKVSVELWMEEFVRGRHSQEEWDAFFDYCQAGPWKRRFIRWNSMIATIFGLI